MGGRVVIFVTVGSSLPFDRLIEAADAWAGTTTHEVFAQVGNSQFAPRHMRYAKMLTPSQFSEKVQSSVLVVAHAGMGTVISAMEAGKPIVVMPRQVAGREVTTDHQVHTAHWLKDKAGVFVARAEDELGVVVAAALRALDTAPPRLRNTGPPELIARIRSFLDAA